MPRLSSCLAKALNAAMSDAAQHGSGGTTFPAGMTFGAASGLPLSFPSLGDDSAAYRVTLPVTYNGMSLSFTFDLVFYIQGRAGVTMTYFGVQGPLPNGLETRLANLVASRLPAT